MANFLDNVKNSFNRSQEESKLKKQIATVEGEIQSLKLQMGNALYIKMRDGEDADFDALYEAITAKETAMAELQQKLLTVNGLKKCPNCGKETDVNAQFCMNCGTKFENIPTQDITEEPVQKTCKNCGAIMAEGSMFCSKCGAKYEEEAADQEVTAQTICPQCGAVVEAGNAFCPKCGAKQ